VAFVLGIIVWRKRGHNGVTFSLLMTWLGNAAAFYLVLCVWGIVHRGTTPFLLWWANVVQLQAGMSAIIILGRRFRA